jgi:hypothetical protein
MTNGADRNQSSRSKKGPVQASAPFSALLMAAYHDGRHDGRIVLAIGSRASVAAGMTQSGRLLLFFLFLLLLRHGTSSFDGQVEKMRAPPDQQSPSPPAASCAYSIFAAA